MNYDIKDLIYQKYISPTEQHREHFVGVEAELPVVNLSGKGTNHCVSQKVFSVATEHFGFLPKKFDYNGICHEAVNTETGDIFSFDCSYNNFEISFGKEKTITAVDKRFKEYVSFINNELYKENHLLTGMGINPYYKVCSKDFINTGRYKMLEGYLKKSTEWNELGPFHKYPNYASFSSAIQVQLDIEKNNLLETLRVFSLLEPVKTVLFANSIMEDEPNLLCTRDMLWEKSTHGINLHNVGMYDVIPKTIDELVEYISYTSIFCAERDEGYMFFKPIPFAEYLGKNTVECEYYKNGTYHKSTLVPNKNDIKYLRTYKFTDLTSRGTIEFRSTCTQPLSEEFSSVAFNIGLIDNLPELSQLFEKDNSIYNHGFSATELRRILNKEEYPDFVDKSKLKNLLINILFIAQKGLKTRGFGEEIYLKPLFNRAENLLSPAREIKQKLNSGTEINELIRTYSEL